MSSDDDISDDEAGGPPAPAQASGFSIFTSKSLADHRDEIFTDVRDRLPGLGDDDSDELSDDDDDAAVPIFSSLKHTANETADLSDIAPPPAPTSAEPDDESALVAAPAKAGTVAAAYSAMTGAGPSPVRSKLDEEGYAGMDSGVGRPTIMSNEEYRALRRTHRERWLQEEHEKMYSRMGARAGTLDMATEEALEQHFFKQVHGEDDTETRSALAASQAAAGGTVDLGIDRALGSIDLDKLLANVRSAENAREKERSDDPTDAKLKEGNDEQRAQARTILAEATSSLNAAYESVGRETPSWQEPGGAAPPVNPAAAWGEAPAVDEARAAQQARLVSMQREGTLQKIQEEALQRERREAAAGGRGMLGSAAQMAAAMQQEIVVDDLSSDDDDDPVLESPPAPAPAPQKQSERGLMKDEIRAREERRAAARARGGGGGGRGRGGGHGRGGGRGARSSSESDSSSDEEVDLMAVRRQMKQKAEAAKKAAPRPAPAPAPASPPNISGRPSYGTPDADSDSDDDKLFFTPSVAPTSDDIFARAFDQIAPEIDVTDMDDMDDEPELEEEDLSSLPTIEREMKTMERERQKLLRQSVPDDWKPVALMADDNGEDTIIEVELDEEDKAAMAKLRTEMNRRWRELHPNQPRNGEPAAPPPIKQVTGDVDAGAEAAEDYRKNLSARLSRERQEARAAKEAEQDKRKAARQRQQREPRPKIFEHKPLGPQPTPAADAMAAAIPLMEKEKEKAQAKAEALRVSEAETEAATAVTNEVDGRAEVERQLSEARDGLFSKTFSYEQPLSGLPVRAMGEVCVLAVLDVSPAVTADVVSWLMAAPEATRKSLRIPGAARVIGALLTSSSAVATAFSSSTASSLADSVGRCVLLALEVPTRDTSDDDYTELDDELDDFLRQTPLSQVLQPTALDAFGRSAIGGQSSGGRANKATLGSICKVMEPFDASGNSSASLFSTPMSSFINGAPVDTRSASSSTEACLEGAVETTVSVMKREPGSMQRSHLHRVLSRVDDEGLDLVGLRMFYPTTMQSATIADAATWAPLPQTASLVLAVRGVGAVARWQKAVGPDDPLVARKTDPRSLRATLGADRDDNLLTCARPGASWSKHELPLYFGGRVPTVLTRDGAEVAASRLAEMQAGQLPGLATFQSASALLLFSPSAGASVGGCLAAAAARGLTVQAMTRTAVPASEVRRLVGTDDGFHEQIHGGERFLSCLAIVSRENLEHHLPRAVSSMVDKMESCDGKTDTWVTGHRVPANEVPALAPLLMTPSADAARSLGATSTREFYISDELADITCVAFAGSRRALWSQALDELTGLGFSLVAVKVLPKLLPTVAAALWLPEESGLVCMVAKLGGTAELQALKGSVKRTSPRGAPPIGLVSASSGSTEVLTGLFAEQPVKCTLSRDARTAYSQAVQCFSLTDLQNVELATAAEAVDKPYDGPDAWARGDAAYFFSTNPAENLSQSLVMADAPPGMQAPTVSELTRRAFAKLFPRGAKVTTVGVEISATPAQAQSMPRHLRQLHRAGFSFERLQMVATSSEENDTPRVVGLLRRETAEQTLPTTIKAQRMDGEMAPLNPTAVEAMLPVASSFLSTDKKQLARPASSLKETLCILCLPSMLQGADEDESPDAKSVEMEAGIAVLEELAAEDFRLVGMSLRKLGAEEAEAYAAAHAVKARGWTVATMTAALLQGPALVLVVEKENGGSRLAMLMQGGGGGGRRMGGGASQSAPMADAFGASPACLVASTTAKTAAADITLLFSELYGSWATLE